MSELLCGIILKCFHSSIFIFYECIFFHRVDFHLLVTVFAGWNHSLAFYPYFRSLFSFIPSLPYDSPLLSPLFAQ